MRVVFFGTPQFAVPSLEALIAHPDFTVVAVVTQPDKRRGRGNQLSPSPVKAVAVQHEIPVIQPRSIKKSAADLAQLRDYEADVFVVVAYGQILSQEILDMPHHGCVNGHGSLLPQYRGAAPIQWCLYNGETATGMTTMLMDIGMDTGAMLLKSDYAIGLFDTAHDLAVALSQQAAQLIVETLPQLVAGRLTPVPQVDADATYASLIQKPDYELDWSKRAIDLHNQVRGFYPNCVTQFRNQGLKVIATVPLVSALLEQLPAEYVDVMAQLSVSPDVPPGAVATIVKKHGVVMQTGEGLLLLKQVQPAGKKAQSGWDFANGMRVEPGERLGPT
ncbi:methionyl-tRNA formyltransferase [filamentous cyanobacterium LEGE 11480]|uniref:Methionyl-tRNA formyltransferase n=1 Tax=Romeriopsis navalis LEGE 11480 TaxID=2777977 RepID=A0A928Z2M4_9CYAN|nr:methionyl-tRNA formyltransferase [Romeriopsis navalis]MBE9029207.1 methionyl-tRNA formyltransferase [Romeriopsis navalis LEGE 11480]